MINFQNEGKTKGKLQCQRTRGPVSFPGLSDCKQVLVLTILKLRKISCFLQFLINIFKVFMGHAN